jgi:site-specific DNA-methyltransferase (adenine-specific)
MITIEQTLYNKMPIDLQGLFNKLPNYGSEEVVSMFPNTKSGKGIIGNGKGTDNQDIFGKGKGGTITSSFADSGSASRFFYCAKASKSERNAGCDALLDKERVNYGGFHSEEGLLNNGRNPENRNPNKNNHPTVKPIALMEYLVKLVSKEGAIILDPFAGSGSTGVACKNINRDYILIEREDDYIPIINARLKNAKPKTKPLTLF